MKVRSLIALIACLSIPAGALACTYDASYAGTYVMQSETQEGELILTYKSEKEFAFDISVASKAPSHANGHVKGAFNLDKEDTFFFQSDRSAGQGENCKLQLRLRKGVAEVKQQDDCLVGVGASFTGSYGKTSRSSE